MKKLFSVYILALFLINSAISQITHLENYYEGQGGIEGLEFPKFIITDTSGQNLFIAAGSNGPIPYYITHLIADSTYNNFTYKERLRYSFDSLNGLWNVDEIALNRNNKFFYVTGDECLYVFSKDQLSSNFHYEQSFHRSNSFPIGYASSTKISIPPDNKNLYLSTSYALQDNVMIFSMDSITGRLTYKRKIPVDDISYIASSCDNNYLYTASLGYGDTSLCVFKRIIDTDSLILVQKLTNNDSIKNPCIIVGSKDSRNIYVYDNSSILIYNVNAANGTLLFNQKLYIDSCFNNFWFAKDIVLSHDDSYLYVAGMEDVSVYSRNPSTGQLTFIQVIQEGINNFHGFDNLYSIFITKSDTVLYLASKYNNSILVFLRDASTGLLTYYNKVTDGDKKIGGLNCAVDIAATRDNKHLYTVADGYYLGGKPNIIGIYKRLSDGRLDYIRALQSSELGTAVGATYSIEISPDDEYVFIGSTNMYGIRIFKRDTASGNLVFYKSHIDPGLNLEQYISDLTFTPDQKFFYAATYSNIMTYSVRSDSADINFLSRISSNDIGLFGLEGIRCMIASNDKKNIYTSSISNFSPDGISVYTRNLTNGSLSILQNIQYIPNVITNLYPKKIVLSPDGRFLYSIGTAIHSFRRDTSNGRLTFINQIILENMGIPNLYSLDDASISGDGKSFVGVGKNGKLIIFFYRNNTSGLLTYGQSELYSNNNNYNLSYDTKMCITQDSKNVYLIQQYDELLAAYTLFTQNNSIGEFQNDPDIKVYPNPTTGILTVSVNEDYLMNITDIEGRIIYDHKISKNQIINMTEYPSGIYILKVINNYKCQIFKILKL